MDGSTLESVTRRVVDALARGEQADAAALRLLLRRFSDTARVELAEALGAALARELDRQADQGCDSDCEGWLALFSEAAAISDDPRLPDAVAHLLPRVRGRWTDPAVDVAMRAVDASLMSLHLVEDRGLAASAIDALERIIAGAYRPGKGVAHEIGGATFIRGGLADHVRSAATLVTAYALANRLPYAMLADEMMQSVLRTPAHEDVPFALECDAAGVFCRLAALHRDEEYQRTAVLPAGADYAENAARVLAALMPRVDQLGLGAAPFGLALAEWLDLQ